MKQPRVIISGGGTGGHIFPAVSIANAIKKIHPEQARKEHPYPHRWVHRRTAVHLQCPADLIRLR